MMDSEIKLQDHPIVSGETGAAPAPHPQHGGFEDVIEANGNALAAWTELWRYRELLYFLTWRDIKIRYKQTVLGVGWAILQPFMSMVVFSVFFGRLAGMEHRTGGVPYPVYVFTGLLPWTFFANAVTTCGNSVVNSAHLVTKVYFPRMIIPISAAGVGVVDFLLSLLVLFGMMIWFHTGITGQVVLLPIFMMGTTLVTVGAGTFLAALTVNYRDFRYIVPFFVQLWMFVTPVIYPSSLIPSQWRWIMGLNPLAGMIDGFRAALLGRPVDWAPTALSLIVSILLFVGGVAYFRKVERRFADVI